jgi:benzoyl-CoA reductase/2-hydroxyglutaryl-CoA dehydratase subunit BcrC/BadD/HgdB
MSPPNWKVPHLIETLGGVVVAEESCIGSRYYSPATPASDGTLEGQLGAIADRLLQVNCACFTPNDERVEDVVRLAQEYGASGVIHYNLQFCQPYANEAVKVERALADRKIRTLRLQTDYSESDTGQLRTRMEAFLEMLR